jgi:phage shock protein PspC (stress-responsive transcriptional regulator)/FtsH-binding integral membrane protein
MHRVLRRSRTDRVGAGVAGGLGEYFGVDPVLFRVLFATAAFFGGAGVLAYLLAWVAIPEQGTVHAPIDGFVGALRRRRIPVWLVAVAAGLLFWAIAFSWWAPRPFFPVMVVVIILVAIFGRRARRSGGADPTGAPSTPDPGVVPGGPVSMSKPGEPAAMGPAGSAIAGTPTEPLGQPAWMADTRSWISEAREASRERRRRAAPVRLTALGLLILAIGIIAAVDAASGVPIPVYFWVTFGIVVAALLVGMALRRTPWSLAFLLPPAVVGLIAFGATGAQFHDGIGVRTWTPTSAASLNGEYRFAFGQGVLNLRNVGPLTDPRHVDVVAGAGQIRIILPQTMNATVDANVHFGVVNVGGQQYSGWHSHGVNVSRTVLPPTGATGAPITIEVHLADGNVAIDHRS